MATQHWNSNVYFIFEYRLHMRARNLLQAFRKCLQEMLMRWFEKEFSNMRFAIAWWNSQTWDGLILDRETLNMRGSWYVLLLDEGILSIRCLCDALLLDEGILKHKVLCYWMTEFSNMRCFTVVWGNSQLWYYLILDEGTLQLELPNTRCPWDALLKGNQQTVIYKL